MLPTIKKVALAPINDHNIPVNILAIIKDTLWKPKNVPSAVPKS